MQPASDKPLSLADYYDDVVRISWHTAVALQAAGTRFTLLLCSDDPASTHMQALLRTALAHHKLGMITVEVCVDCATAHKLSVAVVPQLRFYNGGKEIGRHRGTMDYDVLVRALDTASGGNRNV